MKHRSIKKILCSLFGHKPIKINVSPIVTIVVSTKIDSNEEEIFPCHKYGKIESIVNCQRCSRWLGVDFGNGTGLWLE
jgi:hypothetical protein